MSNIFKATEKDIPAIIEIAEKTWWPAYSKILSEAQILYMLRTLYSSDAIRKVMQDESQDFLILTNENGPQAFASYGKHANDPLVYTLHKLYVAPDNQGKGYGKALVTEIKNHLLKSDIHQLDVNVNRHNAACGFYQKLGFKIMREEDNPIGHFWMNDYVMRMEF